MVWYSIMGYNSLFENNRSPYYHFLIGTLRKIWSLNQKMWPNLNQNQNFALQKPLWQSLYLLYVYSIKICIYVGQYLHVCVPKIVSMWLHLGEISNNINVLDRVIKFIKFI